MVPRTCRAKLGALTTSTVETSVSTTRESLDEFSTVTWLALPLIMIVVLLQRLIRIECDRAASIVTGSGSFS
jgi:hypothetical protein